MYLRVFEIENHKHFVFSTRSVPACEFGLGRRGNVVPDRHMEVGGVEIRNVDLDLVAFSQIV